jgi:hypothetical protein
VNALSCLGCAPGLYGSKAGAINQGDGCSPCSNGKYSTAVGAADETTCTMCPQGFNSPSTDQTGEVYCLSCLPGRKGISIIDGGGGCVDCDKGRYRSSENQDATSCLPCTPGKYQANSGQAACIHCPPGQYQSTAMGTACKQCARGKYNDQTNQTTCQDVPPNKYTDFLGATSFLTPPPGFTALLGGRGLHKCEMGTFERNKDCKTCPAGWDSAEAAIKCSKCDKGKVTQFLQLQDGGNSSSSVCTNCDIGTYQDETGQSLSCKQCQGGKLSTEGASSCYEVPSNTAIKSPTINQTTIYPISFGPPWNISIDVVNEKSHIGPEYKQVVVWWSTDESFPKNQDKTGIVDAVPISSHEKHGVTTVRFSTPTSVWYDRYYFRAAYYVINDAGETQVSVKSSPTAPTSTTVTCTDDEYLKTHKSNLCQNNVPTDFLSMNDVACMPCPKGGQCKGDVATWDIAVQEGFWRVPWALSTEPYFVECPIRSQCLGVYKESTCVRSAPNMTTETTWVLDDSDLKRLKIDDMCPFRPLNTNGDISAEDIVEFSNKNGKDNENCVVNKESYKKEQQQTTQRCREDSATTLPNDPHCGVGSRGVLCTVCSRGYAMIGGQCQTCPPALNRAMILVPACLLIVLIMILVYRKLKTMDNDVRNSVRDINRIIVISLTLAQINVSILTQIRVPYPDNLKLFISLLNFVNFDLTSLTGATCDADVGFQITFVIMLIIPALVVTVAVVSFLHGKVAVSHKIAVLKKSSPALREFESIVCYEELFRVVDVDNSNLVDADEFVDLLRLCGYEMKVHGSSRLTNTLAESMIQDLTGSEYTTQLSKPVFVQQMHSGNLGKVVMQTLESLKKSKHQGSGRKLKPQRRNSSLLQNAEELIAWNHRRKLFNDSLSAPTQILMLLHAPISRKVFQYFDCEDIKGQRFLRADYEVNCDDPSYDAFMTIILGVLLFMVLGLPMIVAVFLFRYRKKLYTPGVHGKVGWLYGRFRRNNEAWEVYEMLRRMILIGAVVLMPSSPTVRACMCMVVCVIGVGVLNFHQPYRNTMLFWVDQVAQALALFQYMCAVLLDENFNMPKKEREQIGWIIIVANVAFWGAGLIAIGLNLLMIRQHMHTKKTFRDEAVEGEGEEKEQDVRSIGKENSMTRIMVAVGERREKSKTGSTKVVPAVREKKGAKRAIKLKAKRGSVHL